MIVLTERKVNKVLGAKGSEEKGKKMKLSGLHHVSAVTGDVAGNVEFYTQVLGLRLVKKTVNQDDVSMYHLFYGDEAGHAGTSDFL